MPPQFADDHREFLSAVLPVGTGWPDWRDGDEADLRRRLEWPVEGVLFDVEQNGFWYDGWGRRPSPVADALAVARRRLADVPRLVPVYGHRYLAAGRGSAGHPVLSVQQTDIIVYGTDLADYLRREFDPAPGTPRGHVPGVVAFWRDLAD